MNLNRRFVIASALAAAVAAPALFAASSLSTSTQTPAFKAEKCYGIAKAGKNDCAATGNSSCAGTSKLNGDPNAWIYVAEGYCERIVNGSLKPKA